MDNGQGVRVCVLGSGSGGNATLIQTPHANILVDVGFSPDEIGERLDGTGVTWEDIHAVVLTHTHGDHLKKRSLKAIAEHEIPFYLHESHLSQLSRGRYMKKVLKAEVARPYHDTQPFEVCGELIFHPFRVPHDCPPTFAFRIETANAHGQPRRIGLLADMGHWTPAMVERVWDVDLLALEFNHDEDLERRSGRHPKLINRVLSDEGHLSNRQAADLLGHIYAHGPNGGPKRVVQMHLSGDCNRPDLAYQAAREVIDRFSAHTEIFSTRQDQRGTVHDLG